MLKMFPLLAGLIAIGLPDAARGAVTVIGGGLAEACSQAAMAGEDDPRF